MSLRLMTWNIAHGRGPSHGGPRDPDAVAAMLDGIAAVLRREQPDVVALQEVDQASTTSGGFDHLDYLARAADMPHQVHGEHFALSVGRTCVRSGTALLSRHPWVRQRSAPFARAWRDNKGWVAGTLPWEGGEIEIFSIHLDFLNPWLRRRQLRVLTANLACTPSVVAGDFNSPRPLRPLFTALRQAGPDAPTFPVARPLLCLDRVWCSPNLAVTNVTVLPDRHADHRPVAVTLQR